MSESEQLILERKDVPGSALESNLLRQFTETAAIRYQVTIRIELKYKHISLKPQTSQ